MGVILTNNNQGGRIRVLRTTPGINQASAWIGRYVLDSYPGAVAAYSLRKLRYDYKGAIIRVRRDSDNAEQDIGFDGDGIGSRLDEKALTAFVGSANGFVTTWYDQSGNGVDQFRSISNQQPQIVTNGTIYTDNGKPALWFNGNMSMRTTISINLTSLLGEWSTFGVFRPLDFSIARLVLSSDGVLGGPLNERIGQFLRTNSSQRYDAIGFRISSPPAFVNDNGPIATSNQAIVNSIRTINTVEIFANTISNGPSSIIGTPTTMARPLDIGYRDGISFSVFQPYGYIQEIIHYPLDSTSFYQEMVQSINHHYRTF